MTKKQPTFIFGIIVVWLAQLACNSVVPSQGTPDTFATLDGLYTASALTLEAAGTSPALTATPGLPLPTPTSTSLPVLLSPVPQSKCDAAQFLADVTIPDGSLLPPGSSFTKTWRIKNIGTCTWTTSYALVFINGDAMSAPVSVAMPGSVNPGQYIEIPVKMTAPGKEGAYRGYWKLRNSAGVLFGIGTQADTAIWVDVKVAGPSYTAYNFAENYCDAKWQNGSDELPCPGINGDEKGFAIKLNNPVMENGVTENAPGLLTVPQDKNNGFISGLYPAITVQQGDRFRAIVNCAHNSPKCNVVFRLDYRLDGVVKTFASWQEVYEGGVLPIDLDLSSLAGKKVRFNLFVSANGGNNQDNALWLNPRILRLGTPPPTATRTQPAPPSHTPTMTPTPTFTATPTATHTPETPTETPEP
jgi:hypothetical protein